MLDYAQGFLKVHHLATHLEESQWSIIDKRTCPENVNDVRILSGNAMGNSPMYTSAKKSDRCRLDGRTKNCERTPMPYSIVTFRLGFRSRIPDWQQWHHHHLVAQRHYIALLLSPPSHAGMNCLRSLVIFMLLLNHYYCSVMEDFLLRVSLWINPSSAPPHPHSQ